MNKGDLSLVIAEFEFSPGRPEQAGVFGGQMLCLHPNSMSVTFCVVRRSFVFSGPFAEGEFQYFGCLHTDFKFIRI
jgi:hypothetical protein